MNIPLSSPDITDADRNAVMEVLQGKCLSIGNKQVEFEQFFARYIGVKHAIAVNSGTSGLHLVVRSMGIKDGDEVITTPFSFVASANCILMERATPVFVDIDINSWNIDTEKIERKITNKTKAILAVDLLGMPCWWLSIKRIAEKYKLFMIEDSCEALGAKYNGKLAGSFGHASVFGFYPNKQITTLGEGGMILTNNDNIAELCRSMRNQGRGKTDNWFEHLRLGYNYRLSEANCAMGITQLRRIDEILTKRNWVAQDYNEKLRDVDDVVLMSKLPNMVRSWFVYIILLKRANRDNVIRKLEAKGIQCGRYFQPIHMLPFYNCKERFNVTEYIAFRTIALPFHNNLTQEEINYVTDNLKIALEEDKNDRIA